MRTRPLHKSTVIKLKFVLPAIYCFAVMTGSWGCAAQKQRINRQQSEIDGLKREIVYLKDQNSQVRRELDSLNKLLAELANSNRQDKADVLARIEELLQQVEAVQNQLLDTNSRMAVIDEKSGSRALEPDFTNPATDAASDNLDQFDDLEVQNRNNSRELYNTSYRDLLRGNYQLALSGFQQFVQQYPNADLTDNAQYWVGEVYYAQGRYANAIAEFEKVVKWYRNGDKTASALLKIAYSYIASDEIEQGKLYLEEVIQEHPDSEEAELAKGRLASLN